MFVYVAEGRAELIKPDRAEGLGNGYLLINFRWGVMTNSCRVLQQLRWQVNVNLSCILKKPESVPQRTIIYVCVLLVIGGDYGFGAFR